MTRSRYLTIRFRSRHPKTRFRRCPSVVLMDGAG